MTAKVSPRLSLRRNFSHSFVGNVIYAGTQWMALILLAKWGTPELVGQFSLGLAISAPILLATNLQLRNFQATDVKGEYHFRDYLTLRLITSLLALILIGLVVVISGVRGTAAVVTLVVGLAKVVESVSDVYYGLFQNGERLDLMARSMIMRGTLALVMMGLGVLLTESLVWYSVAMVAAWLVVLLLHDLPIGTRLLVEIGQEVGLRDLMKPSGKALRRLVVHTLPLGGVALLISLNGNIPRYFVEGYLGSQQLGIFSALAYLMVVGNTVVTAMAQSAAPRLARVFSAGDISRFVRLMGALSGLGLLLGVGGVGVAVLAGDWLLSVVYATEYGQHSGPFSWLMVAAGVSYVAGFLNYGLNAVREFKVQVPLFMVVGLVTVGAGYLLIPRFGLVGAAGTVLVQVVVQVAGSSLVLLRAIRRTHHLRETGEL